MPSLPLSQCACVFAGGFPGRANPLPSEEVPERPEVEVEVLVLEPELRLQLLHPLAQPHERLAEPLDLLVRQGSLLHPPHRLALHQLAEELDQRQDELRQAALHRLRVAVDPAREDAAELLEPACDSL